MAKQKKDKIKEEDREEDLDAREDNNDGEEGDDGEDSEDGDEEGGGKKKIIIIAIAAILLLAGIGAGVFFMLNSGPVVEETQDSENNDSQSEEATEEHGEEGEEGKEGYAKSGKAAFIPIPTMLVNLNTDDGVPRYLRLTVQLELKNDADSAAVEAIMPRVIDQFQTYLRELRVKDLRGSGGIYRLQTELLWRVNQAAAPVKIKDVLFQEILIQ